METDESDPSAEPPADPRPKGEPVAHRSHRRRTAPGRVRRSRRHPALIPGAALAAVAIVVSLVVAFRPDGGSGDGGAAQAGAGAVVEAQGTPETGPTPSASASPSLTGTPSPSPSVPSSSPASSSAPPKGNPEAPAPSAPPAAAREEAVSGSGSGGSKGSAGSRSAPLAGRIQPGITYKGVATSYDAGDGNGACSFGPTGDTMTAAMNTADYETSKACGAYVRVQAGAAAVTVRITNECPAPCEPGQLDLSQQAFAKLADLSAGRIAITWSLVSPSDVGTVSVRYKTGSSQYWCGIQVLGHRNPVARLEVRSGGSWKALDRAEYDYFLSEQGAGCGAAIRITDIYGEQLITGALPVKPDAVQATDLQFTKR